MHVLQYGILVNMHDIRVVCLSKHSGRTVPMATVTIRLDDETRDRIAAAAGDRGVTVSNYIRDALENTLTLEGADGIGGPRSDLEESVSLTTYQRKVLVMLHRNLLAAKGDLNDSYYDPEDEVRSLKILEGGFAGDYAKEFVDVSDSMTAAECELVWDILDMFRVIQSSMEKLGESDPIEIDSIDGATRSAKFRGFDLNDSQEARLLMYARYLVSDDRWAEQAEAFGRENDRGNSHTRMLPTYRAMLRVFKPLWRQTVQSGARWHLSKNELESILKPART